MRQSGGAGSSLRLLKKIALWLKRFLVTLSASFPQWAVFHTIFNKNQYTVPFFYCQEEPRRLGSAAADFVASPNFGRKFTAK